MKVVKSDSSKWIKTKGRKYSQFKWQAGYGAFSIQYNKLDRVIEYIKNQEQHHQNQTFKSEYKNLLSDNNIEYDERYLWS